MTAPSLARTGPVPIQQPLRKSSRIGLPHERLTVDANRIFVVGKDPGVMVLPAIVAPRTAQAAVLADPTLPGKKSEQRKDQALHQTGTAYTVQLTSFTLLTLHGPLPSDANEEQANASDAGELALQFPGTLRQYLEMAFFVDVETRHESLNRGN
jgi:hypothetical protein